LIFKKPFQESLEMAAAGTLLADLDGQSGSDGDLVQKILSDMSIPTGNSQRSAPPPLPAQAPIYQQMGPTSQVSMDSQIPRSHMIGNEHPSPADFASAMGSSHGPGGMQGMGMGMQGMGMGMQMPGMQMPGMQMPGMGMQEPSKNLYGRILEELKVPLVVAILFFVFSLPPIRVLISHYIPSFIKSTGELQTTGLLAVSGVVAATFWLLQRVIAPLLSL
jgi:hypothetical protein